MGVCFLCDTKLFGERTRVCSSITPHSNVPYPEKVAELLGDDFVVIVTPADHMCKKCTSLLTHMDKLENDLKLVKNALLSYVQKKYGLLPPDQPVKTLDVINGHLKTDDLEIGQKKVPSGLNITLNRENTPLATPLKMLKPPGDNSSAKIKIYKCGFCTFQSKELGHVRFHMRTHMNKKEEKANQPAKASAPIKATPPPKKRLYRCQVCSASFDSRINCLDHIQKNHNSSVASAKSFKNKASEELKLAAKSEKSQDEEQTETMTEVNDHQLNKGTVNTDMMLNDNLSTGVIGEQDESQSMGDENGTQEDTMNTQEDTMNTQEDTMNSQEDTMNSQEDTMNSQEDDIMNSQEDDIMNSQDDDTMNSQDDTMNTQVDTMNSQEDTMNSQEETMNSQEVTMKINNKTVDEKVTNGSEENNKASDLDIESMLAAIHHDEDPSSNIEDTQNIV